MQDPVEIENIEDLRLREGIDDVELRREIQLLKAGDFVKVTLLTSSKSFETLWVLITSRRGPAFRGKLASKPTSTGLSRLRVGAPITFAAAHIHSIPKGHPTNQG
jgi:hypothetical protein